MHKMVQSWKHMIRFRIGGISVAILAYIMVDFAIMVAHVDARVRRPAEAPSTLPASAPASNELGRKDSSQELHGGGHVEVIPAGPAVITSTTMGSVGPLTVIPLPGTPTPEKLKQCEGQSLMTSLDVINLTKLSGVLRIRTTDGVSQIKISEGKIVAVNNTPWPKTRPVTSGSPTPLPTTRHSK